MRILTVAALVAAGVLAGLNGAPTAAAQSACVDLGGTVGQDQICRVHTANPTYSLDFSFLTGGSGAPAGGAGKA